MYRPDRPDDCFGRPYRCSICRTSIHMGSLGAWCRRCDLINRPHGPRDIHYPRMRW